jgi:hypothetical protein
MISVLVPQVTQIAAAAQQTFDPTASVEAQVTIVTYSIIFLLSFVGNALVLVTLGLNRRLRSVTNLFLLNLVSALMNKPYFKYMNLRNKRKINHILSSLFFTPYFLVVSHCLHYCYAELLSRIAISLLRGDQGANLFLY